jgi:two-component system sensor histidine kinase/response regulator
VTLPSNDGKSLILVVDDEWLNRELMDGLLTVHGYAVVLAHSGTQGLELAPVRLPQLILLDVRMPDMDGYTVCKRGTFR